MPVNVKQGYEESYNEAIRQFQEADKQFLAPICKQIMDTMRAQKESLETYGCKVK